MQVSRMNRLVRPVVMCINITIIFLIVFILIYFNFEHGKSASPPAKQGIVDLRTWDFNKNGIIKLNGEWEFYGGKLLAPEDFNAATKTRLKRPGYIKVPYPWKGRINAQKGSSQGIGTYRLILLLKPSQEIFGIKTANIRMSHHLYINGVLRSASGNPAAYRSGIYQPGNTPCSAFFNVNGDRAEIIIQVANYTFPSGGIVSPIRFGLQKDILQLHLVTLSLELAAILVLLLFGIYHLCVYLMRIHDQSYLYCGIFFILLAGVVSYTGEKIFMQFFPAVPFTVAYKSMDVCSTMSFIVLALFIKALDENFVSHGMMAVFSWVIFPYILAIIFLPFLVYSYLKNFIWVFMMIFILGIFIKLIIAYIKEHYGSPGKTGLRLLNIAIVCVLFYFGDTILYINNMIDTDVFGEIAFFGFIIVMALMIAQKFSNAHEEAYLNEMAFLQSQIKPHFLYNTISTIISFCHTDSKKAAHLLENFSRYLRLAFDIDNSTILTTLERELQLVKAYVEIEKARFGERLHMEYDIDESLLAAKIPPLIIQPLVENAIRHGILKKEHGGAVKLSVREKGQTMTITITDNGIGMPEEMRRMILSHRMSRRGVGISNINRRLAGFDGASMSIRSIEGNGTHIEIVFPIVKQPAKSVGHSRYGRINENFKV